MNVAAYPASYWWNKNHTGWGGWGGLVGLGANPATTIVTSTGTPVDCSEWMNQWFDPCCTFGGVLKPSCDPNNIIQSTGTDSSGNPTGIACDPNCSWPQSWLPNFAGGCTACPSGVTPGGGGGGGGSNTATCDPTCAFPWSWIPNFLGGCTACGGSGQSALGGVGLGILLAGAVLFTVVLVRR